MKEEELTLSEVWEHIQRQLTRAVHDRKHPFRVVVIGSMGKEAVNMRNVVLRKFEATPFTLTFYTDIRSQKIEELKKNPCLTWLFWHPKHQIQVKAIGQVILENQTATTQHIWKNMHIKAKVAYLTRSAPSTPNAVPTSGLSSDILEKNEQELSDRHFCMVRCVVDKVEYLQLNKMEHRRAKFERMGEEWNSTWLVP